ncbi:MAG TPA: hypothetical protein VIC84_03590 [Blastocatellia bacterium]|jgi:hypothetical protein
MIRKILFTITLAALVVSGVRLNRRAASTVKAAADPVAQSCNSNIDITSFDILNRQAGGGFVVKTTWKAPQLPACVVVDKYRVHVTLKFPNFNRDAETLVAGNVTTAQFTDSGFVLDTNPRQFTVTVTALLRTVAAASGSKSGAASINP